MRLVLLAAVADRGVIGVDNQLPWHLPEDLRRFKALTLHHVVVMGRLTFESIVQRLGRPLPQRISLVLTRDAGWSVPDHVQQQALSCGAQVQAVHRLEDLADAVARVSGADGPVYVIGGAQIYQATMPLADALDITRVHLDVAGDAFFPVVDSKKWECESGEMQTSEQGGIRFQFQHYRRQA